MSAQQISVTVDRDVYEQFERLRTQARQKRSEAVEAAIKMWVKRMCDDLIAQGCQASRGEDLMIARASKKKTLRALARML
jgi:metal-responsive CopG/Arc/MetJ family transcriptional regulator